MEGSRLVTDIPLDFLRHEEGRRLFLAEQALAFEQIARVGYRESGRGAIFLPIELAPEDRAWANTPGLPAPGTVAIYMPDSRVSNILPAFACRWPNEHIARLVRIYRPRREFVFIFADYCGGRNMYYSGRALRR